MKKSRVLNMTLVLLLPIIMVFTSSWTGAAVRYTLTDLGTLGPWVCSDLYGCWRGQSWPTAINNLGHIVGGSQIDWYRQHAFLWTPKTGIEDLGRLYSLDHSDASDINDYGQVVGTSSNLYSHGDWPPDSNAFIWTRKKGMVDIGANYSSTGINNHGQVIGFYTSHDWKTSGFVWTKNGGFVDLGYNNLPLAINDLGQMVGQNGCSPGAYLFDNGNVTYLFPNASCSAADDINDIGQVVGWYKMQAGAFRQYFLWKNGRLTDLGQPSSETGEVAINNIGQVVGEYRPAFVGPQHAFLWNKNEGMLDLNDLVLDRGIWTLVYATGINDAGQIIVVGFADSDGDGKFDETPYGPVTGALLLNPIIIAEIDIKPGDDTNTINYKSKGKIPVAILSTKDFNALTQVDQGSLTFGRTGDEHSLAFCHGAEDVNRDGLQDLVCHFYTQDTGFQCSDTQGILKGKTVKDIPIEGTDSVNIVACK